MNEFGIEYKIGLFINSSKTSLIGVLLLNGNIYASLPITHSLHTKENLKIFLQKINHTAHNWTICEDFKAVKIFLCQQN